MEWWELWVIKIKGICMTAMQRRVGHSKSGSIKWDLLVKILNSKFSILDVASQMSPSSRLLHKSFKSTCSKNFITKDDESSMDWVNKLRSINTITK